MKYSNQQMLIVNMLLYLLGSCKSCNAIVTLLRSPPEIPRTMVPPILLSATFFKPISLMTLFTFIKKNPIRFSWNINLYKLIYSDKAKIRHFTLVSISNFLVRPGSRRKCGVSQRLPDSQVVKEAVGLHHVRAVLLDHLLGTLVVIVVDLARDFTLRSTRYDVQ